VFWIILRKNPQLFSTFHLRMRMIGKRKNIFVVVEIVSSTLFYIVEKC